MKMSKLVLLSAILASSLACQFLLPSNTGVPVFGCAELTRAISQLQAGDIPDSLLETGAKQGDELDVNHYFDVLTHLSMHDGYALDYVYQNDDLGGFPLLYPRRTDRAPYVSFADVPEDLQSSDFLDYVEVEDSEQGYFEYVVLDMMASQFYLSWHANYNDTVIVCDREQVNSIVEQASSGDFGYAMGPLAQLRTRMMRNVEPSVTLEEGVARVQVITFTKWGGFYRLRYAIERSFPHRIVDTRYDNLVPYDCGVTF